MATAAGDGSAKLWDITEIRSGSLRELASLMGHSGAVLDVAFSASGSQIATAALDNAVKLWDETGNELFTIPTETPGMIAFDPTGTRLAVPSADGSVRILVLPLDELLELARTRPTRSFTPAECVRYLREDPCPSR